jgi:hypothetical protein
MNAHSKWSFGLVLLGLVAMIAGAIDPLEGSVIILIGTALATLGAFVGHTRPRKLLGWSLALVAFGVAAMFVLSAFGGIGGSHGHSWWWGLFLLPYPAGWILGLIAALASLVESYKQLASLRNAPR